MANSLWPHGLQHVRLPCPSLSPGVCSDPCPLSWWCCLIISPSAAHLIFCCPLLLLPSFFPSIRVFSSESHLRIRWSKYWSFSFSISFSLSNEYSGLISFRIHWFDLLTKLTEHFVLSWFFLLNLAVLHWWLWFCCFSLRELISSH